LPVLGPHLESRSLLQPGANRSASTFLQLLFHLNIGNSTFVTDRIVAGFLYSIEEVNQSMHTDYKFDLVSPTASVTRVRDVGYESFVPFTVHFPISPAGQCLGSNRQSNALTM